MSSKQNIRRGRVSVTVAICFQPFVSSSIGANMLEFLVSLRSLEARLARRMGPYVSGRVAIAGNVAPATMSPIQKVHRHPLIGVM